MGKKIIDDAKIDELSLRISEIKKNFDNIELCLQCNEFNSCGIFLDDYMKTLKSNQQRFNKIIRPYHKTN